MLTLPLALVWWSPGSIREIVILVSIARLAAAGEVLVIKALEAAEAMVVAPVQYTLMIWSVAYGFLVFGQFPDHWTWVGTAIIIATGLSRYTYESRTTI